MMARLGVRRPVSRAELGAAATVLLLLAAPTALAQQATEPKTLVSYQSWFERSGLTLRDGDSILAETEGREFHDPDSYGSTYPNLQTFLIQIRPGDDDGDAASEHLSEQLDELGMLASSNDSSDLGNCLGPGFLNLRTFETSVFRQPLPAPPEPSAVVYLQYTVIPSLACVPEAPRP